ncbi:MAG: hypothetical protein ACK4NN_06910 [Rheinheimera sp.]
MPEIYWPENYLPSNDNAAWESKAALLDEKYQTRRTQSDHDG